MTYNVFGGMLNLAQSPSFTDPIRMEGWVGLEIHQKEE